MMPPARHYCLSTAQLNDLVLLAGLESCPYQILLPEEPFLQLVTVYFKS